MMSPHDLIINACRGDRLDRIPWVPRLDLWYNARVYAGDMPAQFGNASLRVLTDAIGVGYHAVIPNFLDIRSEDDIIDRCLGIYRLKEMPFVTHLRGVEREIAHCGDATLVSYHTPLGSVSGKFSYSPAMKAAGVSISWIDEHLLKQPADYPVLAYIFSHLEVVRDDEAYRRWQREIGEAGVAVAFGSLSASPMHHIMRELLPVSDFFLESIDYPEELATLAQSMEPWFRAQQDALVASSAEMILMGANFDETITYPPFFEEHILPWVSRLSTMAHAHRQFLSVHTDGENSGLLELYRRCGFDIADSFCPTPMTKMTLPQFIEAMPGVTIWGGIPSIAFCEESLSDDEFEQLTDSAIDYARGRSHLILGIADTMPPNGSFDRVLRMTEKVNRSC